MTGHKKGHTPVTKKSRSCPRDTSHFDAASSIDAVEGVSTSDPPVLVAAW